MDNALAPSPDGKHQPEVTSEGETPYEVVIEKEVEAEDIMHMEEEPSDKPVKRGLFNFDSWVKKRSTMQEVDTAPMQSWQLRNTMQPRRMLWQEEPGSRPACLANRRSPRLLLIEDSRSSPAGPGNLQSLLSASQ